MSLPNRSVIQFVLLQVGVACIGMWGLSGVVQQHLHYQDLVLAYDEQASFIQQQLTQFQAQFPKTDSVAIQRELQTFCVALGCQVETVEVNEVLVEERLQEQLSVVATTNVVDVPIFLEAVRRLPQGWQPFSLEVQGFAEPFRFKLVVLHHLPVAPVMDDTFYHRHLLSIEEQQKVNTMRQWQSFKHYYDYRIAQRPTRKHQWERLYQSISNPLWRLKTDTGKLTYTPKQGVVIQSVGLGDVEGKGQSD